jgi:hypothetical protein
MIGNSEAHAVAGGAAGGAGGVEEGRGEQRTKPIDPVRFVDTVRGLLEIAN